MIGKIAKKLKIVLPGFIYDGLKVVYKRLKPMLKTVDKLYFKIKLKKVQANHKKALEKVRKKEKIKVAFFLIHESVWKYDGVYKLMERQERFEPIVIVCPYIVYGEEIMLHDMNQAYQGFKKKGYNVIKTLGEDGKWLDVKKEIQPDIVFFTNPHNLTRNEYTIDEYLDVLTCYVQYSFNVSYLNQANYNKPFHNFIWKIFTETSIHLKLSIEYSLNKGSNCIVTGYPGTDGLLDSNTSNKYVAKSLDIRKRIIWSPHHTINENDSNLGYSNFLAYAEFFQQLVETYEKKVYFIFKPHPILKAKLYLHPNWGRSKTDDYYKFWEVQINTSLNEGEYIDLFLSSDGLINDSGSYLAEYLFTSKPSLFMLRNDEVQTHFNQFGRNCLDIVYKSYSKKDVITFIEQTILDENDWMFEKRNSFVKEVMLPPNKLTASENIFNYLKKEIL